MKLNELKNNEGAHKKRKRIGRGIGSGFGKTSGRGQKGQKARSGAQLNGFEGGQMPVYRLLPKRVFNSHVKNDFAVVNLSRLQTAFDAKKLDAKKTIDAQALKDAGIISSIRDGVRILGQGELTTKANFAVSGASETAQKAIEKAGGKLEIVRIQPYRRASEKTDDKRRAKRAANKKTAAQKAPAKKTDDK